MHSRKRHQRGHVIVALATMGRPVPARQIHQPANERKDGKAATEYEQCGPTAAPELCRLTHDTALFLETLYWVSSSRREHPPNEH